MPPKSEWLKQGVPMHPAEGLFAYGVRAPRNGTRNFLICLNAYFLKHLLFDTGKKRTTNSKYVSCSFSSRIRTNLFFSRIGYIPILKDSSIKFKSDVKEFGVFPEGFEFYGWVPEKLNIKN